MRFNLVIAIAIAALAVSIAAANADGLEGQWYWCDASHAYYPRVMTCATPWVTTTTAPLAPEIPPGFGRPLAESPCPEGRKLRQGRAFPTDWSDCEVLRRETQQNEADRQVRNSMRCQAITRLIGCHKLDDLYYRFHRVDSSNIEVFLEQLQTHACTIFFPGDILLRGADGNNTHIVVRRAQEGTIKTPSGAILAADTSAYWVPKYYYASEDSPPKTAIDCKILP